MLKKYWKFWLAIFFAVLSAVWTVLLLKVDVAMIGPAGEETFTGGTAVGLSTFNASVRDVIGVNYGWFMFTEAMGVLAILLIGAFAFSGLFQLITRKSFLEVDKKVLAMGVLYILLMGIYLLFQEKIINYRPVIMPEMTEPEPSYPSSHTMVCTVVFVSAIAMIPEYFKKRGAQIFVRIFLIAQASVTVIGRALSGVHWITDIIGGVLISAALLLAYYGAVEVAKRYDDRKAAEREARLQQWREEGIIS